MNSTVVIEELRMANNRLERRIEIANEIIELLKLKCDLGMTRYFPSENEKKIKIDIRLEELIDEYSKVTKTT